jgi:dTMP kinase
MCRDPGSTKLSDELCELLKYREDISISPLAEAFLFCAARAQLLAEVIVPALQKEHTVLCDRFELSTHVYQGLGAGVTKDVIRMLSQVFQRPYPLVPHMTFVLDLPVHTALSRLPEKRDRIEKRGIDYYAQVRNRYQEYAAAFHSYISEYHVIDATGTPEQIHESIWKLIPQTLKQKSQSLT